MKTSRINVGGQIVKELNKKFLIAAIAILIVSAILFGGALAMYLIMNDQIYITTLVASSALLIIAIFYLVQIIRTMKRQIRLNEGITFMEVTFFEDYFHGQTIRNNEVVEEMKVNYSDVIYTKETPSYILIYINKRKAWAVSKDEETINLLKEKITPEKGK